MKGYDVYDKTIKICKFFVNGDPYHTGLTLSLTQRKNPTLKRLLSLLNTKIELVSGRIMKLYHISGTRITDIDQLSSGGKYVMVANDDIFIKCRYDMMVLRSTVLRPLNGQTFQTEMQRVRRAIDDAALKSENVKIGERREEKLSMRGKGFGFIVESATRITAVERAGKKIVKEVVDEEEEFVVQNVSDARVKSREASVPKPTSPKAVGKINSPEPKALASQESAPSKPIHTSNQTKLTNNTTPTHSQSKPTSPVLDHSFNKPTSPPRSHTPTDPISKTSPTKVFDGTKSKIETKIPSNPDIKPRNSIGTKARDSKAASSSSVKSQVPPILSRNSSQKAVVKAEEVEFEDEEFSGESSEVSDEESDEESGEESGEEGN